MTVVYIDSTDTDFRIIMRHMGIETNMTQIDLINRRTECTLSNPKIIKMTAAIR